MIDKIWSAHLGAATVCFGVVAALIYVLMITVTLVQIETVSGHVPFDLRPLGYGPMDAAALLDGLGGEGRRYYLTHQIPLDTAYPTLLALTLVSLMRWFGQNIPNNGLVRVGIIFAIAAAVCDHCENLGIVAMVLYWPDPSVLLVSASSVATVAKSVFTTFAVISAIAIGGVRAMHPKTSTQ